MKKYFDTLWLSNISEHVNIVNMTLLLGHLCELESTKNLPVV